MIDHNNSIFRYDPVSGIGLGSFATGQLAEEHNAIAVNPTGKSQLDVLAAKDYIYKYNYNTGAMIGSVRLNNLSSNYGGQRMKVMANGNYLVVRGDDATIYRPNGTILATLPRTIGRHIDATIGSDGNIYVLNQASFAYFVFTYNSAGTLLGSSTIVPPQPLTAIGTSKNKIIVSGGIGADGGGARNTMVGSLGIGVTYTSAPHAQWNGDEKTVSGIVEGQNRTYIAEYIIYYNSTSNRLSYYDPSTGIVSPGTRIPLLDVTRVGATAIVVAP